MSSGDGWKEKYLQQLEDTEQLEKGWQDERDVLQRLLVRTSLAAEGQAASLDRLLGELRESLRAAGAQSELRRLQQDLDGLVVKLDEARSEQGERIRQSLQSLIHSLAQLAGEPSLRKELKSLQRPLNRRELQVNALAPWLEQLARAQSALLQHPEAGAEGRGRGGFFRRLFHSDEQPPLTELPPTTLGASAPPPPATVETGSARLIEAEDDELEHFVAQVSGLIDQLLAQVSFPEATAHEARQLQARVWESRRWHDLDQALEAVAGLVATAVGNSQREFELFLQRLDERLVHIQAYFQAQQDSQQDRRSASQTLGQDVSAQLSSMGQAVDEASDLNRLRDSVRGHLDQIGRSLEQFRIREAENEALTSRHVGALQEKLAALEAQSEQMRRQLQEERTRALTDLLTGLPNREAWEERLSQEYERWKRYRQPVCLVIIDIDHFKVINDRYGHLAGDKAIRLIGRSLRARLRNPDFVARYGGEEFALLLPETHSEQARLVINELRAHVASLPFHFRGNQVSITFSAGVVDFDDKGGLPALFERADQALYRAKASGRDQVMIARDEPEPYGN